MFLVRIVTLALAFTATPSVWAADLQEILHQRLPLLGHRNWLVIADAAYPVHASPGVETLYVGGDQIDAVATTLKAIRAAKNVRAHVLLDAELASVPESDAPGVVRFRDQLKKLLSPQEPEQILHEAILTKLDETSKNYQVLILKTDFTIPYTSVFLQLDCGYWSPEAEKRLRQSLPSE